MTQTPGGFEDLLRGCHDPMRRLAFQLVGSDYEDVLQTAYVAAYRGHGSFRGESAFATWLYRVVYNTCLNHVQRRRITESIEDIATPLRAVDDTERTVTTRLDVSRALSRLSTDQRAAVWLVDREGMSFASAAESLGVPEGTLTSRLGRGRAALRLELTHP